MEGDGGTGTTMGMVGGDALIDTIDEVMSQKVFPRT